MISCWWRHTLPQSRDYDIIQMLRTLLCSPQMEVFMFTFWCILINVLRKDWNIPKIKQLYDVINTSYINLFGVWNVRKSYHTFRRSIKSLNCVSIVNRMSRENKLKTTSNNCLMTAQWRHKCMCKMLHPKDSTCLNDHLLKVSSNSN